MPDKSMQTAVINDHPLAYCDAGEGIPLLLVHGFPLDHTIWDGQIDPLSRRRRVIAPDLRGFGQSGAADGTVTMEQFADDLAGLLDHLKICEPVVLGGLSMGGYIALAFWRKYAARLRGLILCDTRSAADTPSGAADRETLAQRMLAEGAETTVELMLAKLFAPATFAHRPEIVEAMQRVMSRTNPRSLAAAVRGMARRPDSTPDLPQIACPTLLLVGEDDALTPPAEMRGMAQKIPRARLAVIPEAAHLAPLERPAEVNWVFEEFMGALDQLKKSFPIGLKLSS
ncbi:MAG: alpha/beta fold hydrolase [Pirellulales bacterium]|nr:alpha/beta fold hydrolase [Pirellulales bacterium]